MRFSSHSISPMGRLLGYGGLIPFVALSVASAFVPPEQKSIVIFSLLAYSVTIISFLGAIHWGLTMVENRPDVQRLIWGVVPSLLAWISLMLKVEWGLLLVATVLLVCLIIDFKVYPRYGLGHWLRMRLTLSAVAIVSTALPALYSLGLLFVDR